MKKLNDGFNFFYGVSLREVIRKVSDMAFRRLRIGQRGKIKPDNVANAKRRPDSRPSDKVNNSDYPQILQSSRHCMYSRSRFSSSPLSSTPGSPQYLFMQLLMQLCSYLVIRRSFIVEPLKSILMKSSLNSTFSLSIIFSIATAHYYVDSA